MFPEVKALARSEKTQATNSAILLTSQTGLQASFIAEEFLGH